MLNYIKVLEFLESGRSLTINGYQIVMSESSHICTLATSSEGGLILLEFDIAFNVFVDWCNELDEKQIEIIEKLSKLNQAYCSLSALR